MKKIKAIAEIRNNWKIRAAANAVAKHINRGFATAGKVETVLKEIKSEGIRNLKKLDNEKIREIAEKIAERVEKEEITAKTGQGYISALNAISDYVNHYFNKDIQEIKPGDLGIVRESIEYTDKSISFETHQFFQNFLSENITNEKAEALKIATELQRSFGLRFRESAGLNISTIQKALETGRLELSRKDWTKNARGREIPIRTEQQKELLKQAKEYMEKQGSVNLAGAKNWKDYKPLGKIRNFADNAIKQFKSEIGEKYNFHGERHAYAQNTLENLKNSGISEKEAKGIVSSELGHSPDRDDITRIYLGK